MKGNNRMALEDTIDVTELVGLVETDSLEDANNLITQEEAVLLHAVFGGPTTNDRFVLGYYAKVQQPPQQLPANAAALLQSQQQPPTSTPGGQEDFVVELQPQPPAPNMPGQ